MSDALRHLRSLAMAWAVVIAGQTAVFDRPPTAELLVLVACSTAVSLAVRQTPWRSRV
ncbi:MAG: hypothetical protein ABWZ99_14605 [Ilumatobacteraceae bacterium]